MVMLIGMVVRNGIVLMDGVIKNEKEGMEMKGGLIEGGGRGIRGILMRGIGRIGGVVWLLFGEES
ncbi:hypothetical protein [Staphylococcus epidermidis]|uniref:hypothetical protein n=1 Tax=Staphylococcus epidermidis TaxID=1282 RepID=UPI0037DA4349